jgi:hypothetical protein
MINHNLWYLPCLLVICLFITTCSQQNRQKTAESASGENHSEPDFSFSASNGWADLHTFDLPESGTLVLEINRSQLKAVITCKNRGENPTGPRVDTRMNKFLMSFSGNGITEDGKHFKISGQRQVTDMREGGRVQINLETEPDEIHISVANPETTPLPVLHVDPSGGFTLEGIFKPLNENIHTKALTGTGKLAGRCQEGWPDDQESNP